MKLDINEILERMQRALGVNSDRALCIALGLSSTQGGSWRKNQTIPYKACLLAYEKTGYTMEWMLTGKGPERFEGATLSQLDETLVTEQLIDVFNQGLRMRALANTPESQVLLPILGRMLYTSLMQGMLENPSLAQDSDDGSVENDSEHNPTLKAGNQ